MNDHGYVNLTSCAAWDIDSMNRAGICATAIDNGTMLVCGNIAKDDDDAITGYEFAVTPATAASVHCWIARTPEVGITVEMQTHADPRHFYNLAGEPISIKYLLPHIDCIEVNAETFASKALPTTEGFVTVTTNGKFVAAESAPNGNVTYFSVLGFKKVAVGAEMMDVVILQCENN